MNDQQESYLLGRIHENILQIRNDLHMGDSKAALAKINDAIKLMDENVERIFKKIEVLEVYDY